MVERGDRLIWGGEVVEVLSVLDERPDRIELVLRGPSGLDPVTLTPAEFEAAVLPTNDGGGDSAAAVAALWGKWMEWATPRIRSAATATKPVRPYAHQDEAVFVQMLPQPRLRFLLADEPGTGKTIMAGMYMTEGRRRRSSPARCSSSLQPTSSPSGSPTCGATSASMPSGSTRRRPVARAPSRRRRRVGRLRRPAGPQPRRLAQGRRTGCVVVAGRVRRSTSPHPDVPVPRRRQQVAACPTTSSC